MAYASAVLPTTCTPVIFEHRNRLFLKLFCSVLVIYQFNIFMTDAGAMHEPGYVYSILST